jgi:uncharacterized membrane protein (DUF373 family)
MRLKQELADARRRFDLLNFYGKFEQIVIFILTVLIAVFVIFAVWNLALKVLQSIASSTLDPTDYSVFQTVFGAILTVIIALEFKKSLLVSAERQQSVVQVRTVILIALLAVVRKVLILDLAHATTECLRWRQPSSRLERSIGLSEIRTGVSPAKALRGNAITLPALGEERKLPLRRNSHARA